MTVRRDKRRERFMINFVYRFPDGHRERIRRVAQGTTRRQAEAEENAIRRTIEDGTFGRGEVTSEKMKVVPTVAEFSKTFIDVYAVGTNKPSEVTSKRSVIRNYIEPHLGPKRLDKVGTLDVDAFKVTLLEAGLKPKTVRNALAVVSRMLRYAVEIGLIEKAPMIRFPKCPQPDFDFFDFDEAELLLATAKANAPMWYAPIFVALRTGLRRGELFELRWGDVQLKGRSPHLRIARSVFKGIVGTPKSGKARVVYLTPATVEVLEAELEKARREDRKSKAAAQTPATVEVLAARRPLGFRLVFGAADGSAFSSNSTDWALRHVCELAKLREVGWHVLRHTFASHLAMRDVSLQTIQAQLGHSGVAMTLRYAHLLPESVSAAVAVLDRPEVQDRGNHVATEASHAP